MALKPVAFAKPKEKAPRISAPRVGGRHADRYWSETEDALLREHYTQDGCQYCFVHLARRRSKSSIHQRARKLGCPRRNHYTPRRKENDGSLDDTIRARWAELEGRGAVNRLADDLNVPRWWLSRRAVNLGLSIERGNNNAPWTAAENELMRRIPLHNPHIAARTFREHGFRRTPTAIVVRAKRLDLSRRYKGGYSATAVAKILGLDTKTVTVYIAKKMLAATKRGTQRLPQQGGDAWVVDRWELRRFIIEHIDMIDIRKVDKHAFIDVLTMQSEMLLTALRQANAALAYSEQHPAKAVP